jgi:hypothetical protein
VRRHGAITQEQLQLKLQEIEEKKKVTIAGVTAARESLQNMHGAFGDMIYKANKNIQRR